jgi:serine/threonine protein kinase
MFQHFRHILQEDDYFYFPPEEKPDKHSSSLWSLGILVYSLCFGGKPFQKYEPYHWNSRDQFFMFN